jgi:tetratricopeptide (TPR) repeat protein
MRARASSLYLALTAAVAGCATTVPPAEKTMKSLSQQPTVVVLEVPPSDRQQALDAYLAYARIAVDPDSRMQAMRRIADLQLLISEEELASGAAQTRGLMTAIRYYNDLLREYPEYPDADGVDYQIARAYDDAAQGDASLQALTDLVTRFPRSPLFVEAQFRRAELLFARKDYAGAERAYREALRAGEQSTFYEQALYKHGWSLFKQGRFEAALDDFIAVLGRRLVSGTEFSAYFSPEALPRAQRELVDDTLRVIALSFDRLGGPRSVSAYFQRKSDTPFEHLLYAGLADLYEGRGRLNEAAQTLHAFVEHQPYSEQAPLFQIRVYETYERAGENDLAAEARRDFLRRFGLAGDYWKKRDISRMPAVAARLRKELLTMAQRAHAEAQRTRRDADYAVAAQWYRDYLGLFPNDDQAPSLSFLLGDLLFEGGRYGEAIESYESSAYKYSPHARAAEAGYAALLAYDRYMERLKDEAEKNAWRLRAIDSATRFTTRFPNHAQVPAILTRLSEYLFAAGQSARALATAQRVLQYAPAPDPALRRTAWTVVGHVQFERGNYEEAESAYSQALAIAVTGEKDRTALEERLAASIYQQGEMAMKKGDKAAAARQFERVSAAVPSASVTETADYDAAAARLAIGDWDGAIAVLERFKSSYPDSRWKNEVAQKLAHAYLESGRFGPAAAALEELGHDSKDLGVAREALWQAAELYSKAGDTGQTLRAYQQYANQFPRPLDRAMQARQRIADLYKDTNDLEHYYTALKEIVGADAQAGAARTDFSRATAARAALALAQPALDAYNGIRLVIPLDQSLKAKRRAMQAALDAYRRAADYGVPEVATAATYRIGEIYHDLSRALLDSQRPGGMSEEERQQYDVLLEEQAYPFEEEAIKLHEINFHRISQGVYDEWTKASLKELATLLPIRYAKNEMRESFVESIR